MKRSSLHAAACTGDDEGSNSGRGADGSGAALVLRSSIQETVGDDDVSVWVGETPEDVSWSEVVRGLRVVLPGEEPDSVLELVGDVVV